MTRLHLTPIALRMIREHAAAAYPDECCGALIGAQTANDTTSVIEAYPLPNTTSEGARRRFLVRPADYRTAEVRARTAGAELVGFYHSHPDHPADPSEHDLAHAWPNLSYLIVAVAKGETADLRSWRLQDDRSSFFEETLRT